MVCRMFRLPIGSRCRLSHEDLGFPFRRTIGTAFRCHSDFIFQPVQSNPIQPPPLCYRF
jgi:hypothetical protein